LAQLPITMERVINDLQTIFAEARQRIEFEFVQTLLNYKSIGARELTANLHEWFDAIEFYKHLFAQHKYKEKVRMAALLYSTFFENSDFYNILGSLSRIKLGYKGSTYLFWKTRKYERLLGIGEKQDFLIELLDDAGKPDIIRFFCENHYKEIRNSFFHSAYSLTDEEYILHDSDPIVIDGVGRSSFNIASFFYPKVENVISFFDTFKQLYLDSVASYQEDKEVFGLFPGPVKVTILGSKQGLQGFKVKNAVEFYGQKHDSGIWYDEKFKLWAGHNMTFISANIETIEIDDQLRRYENKADVNKNDTELFNLVDKIAERKIPNEITRATQLLVKFGTVRWEKMEAEPNPYRKQSFPNIILPYYRRAIDIGFSIVELKQIAVKIKELEQQLNKP
jgi:hypothetical protein